MTSTRERPVVLGLWGVRYQVKDVRRSLDYLDTRSDIARDKVGFLGLSWGARIGNVVLAVEPRFKTAVLISGGFPLMQSLPEVKEINFAPRVKMTIAKYLLPSGRSIHHEVDKEGNILNPGGVEPEVESKPERIEG